MCTSKQFMNFQCLTFALLLLIQPNIVFADGFEMFSKHEELKAHEVVDAGDVEPFDLHNISSIGQVVTLGGNCYKTIDSMELLGVEKKAGLLLMDHLHSLKLALLESSIGSIKINVYNVMKVTCPSTLSDGLPSDPQQRLQELIKKIKLMQSENESKRQELLQMQRENELKKNQGQ
jgi:hypothetical protein